MELHISGQHLEVTESLKNFVEEKFEKIIKIAPSMTHAHVILKTDKLNRHLQFCAEANLHMPGKDIHASSEAEEMHNAIVLLMDKLIKQIQRHKNHA